MKLMKLIFEKFRKFFFFYFNFNKIIIFIKNREIKKLFIFFIYRSHVLQKVCMYFTYKVRYTNSSTEIPEFPIAPEIALELLMAGNFLDC